MALLSVLVAFPLFRHPTYLGVEDWDMSLFKLAVPRVTLLHYGQFPLWNPWEGGGLTVIGHPESRFLFPTFLLNLLFGPVLGVKLEIVLHYFLGLWGTYELARKYALGSVAALVASCIYMLSGMCSLSLASGMSMFMAAALIPWTVFFFLRAQHDSRFAIAAGGALALMFLDGGVIFTMITLVILCLHASLDLVLEQKEPRRVVRALALVGISAFAFSAVKLLPALELLREHPRHLDDYSGYSVSSLIDALIVRGQTLGTIVEDEKGFWRGGSYGIDENGMYVGILGVALILVGVAVRPFRLRVLALTSLLLFWLSFGDRAPVAIWPMLHQVPPFTSMRVAQRFRFGAMLGAAMFAGCALDWMTSRMAIRYGFRNSIKRRFGLAVLATLAIDLLVVNSRPFARAFPIPPPSLEAPSTFRQIRALPIHGEQGFLPGTAELSSTVAWSSLYPALLMNLGTIAGRDPMLIGVFPAAKPSEAPEYRGEAYLEDTDGEATIERFSPNRLRIRVTAKAAGVLVINQNHVSGWHSSAGVVSSRHGLLSVPIRAGEQSVDLYYLPTSFVLGASISLAALLIVAIGSLRRRLWAHF